MKTQLQFGKQLIAKNLNNYRVARPTESFWEEWKLNKEELKKEGVSVFKKFGKFYVSLYDGSKSSQIDYDKQENHRFYRIKVLFSCNIMGQEHVSQKEIDDAVETVERAQGYYDLDMLRHFYENYDYVRSEIEEEVFLESIA